MAWTLRISETARRQFKKLDRSTAQTLLRYLNRLLLEAENPRQRGKGLTANRIQDDELLVLVLQVAHRRDVYR